MSDLIIIGYPDEETAGKVWGELVRLERDYLVDLEDAAIVRRDSKGKLAALVMCGGLGLGSLQLTLTTGGRRVSRW